MSTQATIVEVAVHPGMDKNKLFVEMSDGTAGVLLEYYPEDEEEIEALKLVGLTRLEAMKKADRYV
jgi:hypothetical protein